MQSFILNKEKAVNSLLYVVNKLEKADKHKTFKILYFADQKHLVKYGRPIIGDSYVKMDFGPVPSFVKSIIDGEIKDLEDVVANYGKYNVKGLKEADLEFLSESDLECLDESVSENKDLNFEQLTRKSHDFAYNKANWTIDYIDIAMSLKPKREMLNYINQQMINERIEFA